MCIEIGFKLAHMNQTRERFVLTQHRLHEAVDDFLSSSAIKRGASLCPLKKALHCRHGFGVDRMRQRQIRQRKCSWSTIRVWTEVVQLSPPSTLVLSQPLCRLW